MVILISIAAQRTEAQLTRAIKIVVPIAPGGGADILARMLAEQIARTSGRTFVVENRPGAGAIVGTEAVSRAAPDGNTVLLTGNSFVINPNLRKMTYDPLTSFEPVCNLASVPLLIVVNSASPYRKLSDLLEAARVRPGVLTLAWSGPATALHIASAMLIRAAAIDMSYIPYPGTAPAVSALLGEHVTSAFADYPGVRQQLKVGQLRALASATRMRIDPEIPAVAESGYDELEVDGWYGVAAPAKTPELALSQLAGLFSAALQAAEFMPKLAAQGLFPVGKCGAEFGEYLRQQHDLYSRVIRESNIKEE
jgi:tripartite-type tricarboxylate transporter receptor subunit TctC